MAKKLDPLISDFDTQEQADSYDRWFRAKVDMALNEPGATYTHDEVMARLDTIIADAMANRNEVSDQSEKLDPIVSEFETQVEADAHDAWFRAKVQAGLDDKRPLVPHDEAMARLRATIDRVTAQKKSA